MSTTTSDPTELFFAELAARAYEPVLARVTGTVRFDVVDGSRLVRWFVTITKGEVKVSHKNAKCDAGARVDKDDFDRLISGEDNATAALLRGAIVPTGDLVLLLNFQKVFPGPPRAQEAASAGYARRMK